LEVKKIEYYLCLHVKPNPAKASEREQTNEANKRVQTVVILTIYSSSRFFLYY